MHIADPVLQCSCYGAAHDNLTVIYIPLPRSYHGGLVLGIRGDEPIAAMLLLILSPFPLPPSSFLLPPSSPRVPINNNDRLGRGTINNDQACPLLKISTWTRKQAGRKRFVSPRLPFVCINTPDFAA